jgi:hypothetical protein
MIGIVKVLMWALIHTGVAFLTFPYLDEGIVKESKQAPLLGTLKFTFRILIFIIYLQ